LGDKVEGPWGTLMLFCFGIYQNAVQIWCTSEVASVGCTLHSVVASV